MLECLAILIPQTPQRGITSIRKGFGFQVSEQSSSIHSPRHETHSLCGLLFLCDWRVTITADELEKPCLKCGVRSTRSHGHCLGPLVERKTASASYRHLSESWVQKAHTVDISLLRRLLSAVPVATCHRSSDRSTETICVSLPSWTMPLRFMALPKSCLRPGPLRYPNANETARRN
jgi:hypothetical protein